MKTISFRVIQAVLIVVFAMSQVHARPLDLVLT